MSASADIIDLESRRGRSTYSAVAIALHWLIAALMLSNIALAWYFTKLKGPAEAAPLALHKSIGVTVLLLSLARVGWRLTHAAPPLPPAMKPWERFAARAVHVIFYGLMLGMPLSGWAMVSASPLIRVRPTVLFGVIPWPAFPLPGLSSDQLHDLRHLFGATHSALALVAYAVIVLHVAAALKHHFLDRDDVLTRMAPLLRKRAGAGS
jgi:cytochrome b561